MQSQIVRMLLRSYQLTLSPLLHLLFGPSFGCRFTPTCSQYAEESFRIHGFAPAFLLTIKRISRCNPFAQAGYDPVPRGIAKSFTLQKR